MEIQWQWSSIFVWFKLQKCKKNEEDSKDLPSWSTKIMPLNPLRLTCKRSKHMINPRARKQKMKLEYQKSSLNSIKCPTQWAREKYEDGVKIWVLEGKCKRKMLVVYEVEEIEQIKRVKRKSNIIPLMFSRWSARRRRRRSPSTIATDQLFLSQPKLPITDWRRWR